jgi:hypothetical protein
LYFDLMTRWISRSLVIALGVGLLFATALTPARRARSLPPRPALVRPEVARSLFKGMLPLLIDVYWLRTINAVGDADTLEKTAALYDYGNLITDLDPKFRIVYWFVGISLPWREPGRPWQLTTESTALLKKGLVQFPDDLKLNLLLGYNLFEFHKNYVEAAKVFQHAATLPGAPPFAGSLATRLYAQGGTPEVGLELALAMRDSATDEKTRAEFDERVKDLQIEIVLHRVDEAVAAYRAQMGTAPASLAVLKDSGFYSGPMVDPWGSALFLDGEGHARSEEQARRLMLFGVPSP